MTTVARSAVLALLPADYGARYGFGGFGSMPGPGEAQIIIRSVACGNASLGSLALGSVVNSQIGVITARHDAEDFDVIAGNGIDNFQLEFATTSAEIAAAMGAFGIPAVLDSDLSLVFSGDNVNNDSSPLFTATGSHAGPPRGLARGIHCTLVEPQCRWRYPIAPSDPGDRFSFWRRLNDLCWQRWPAAGPAGTRSGGAPGAPWRQLR